MTRMTRAASAALIVIAALALSACGGQRMSGETARTTLECRQALINLREARADVASIRSEQGLGASLLPKRLTSTGRGLRRAELRVSVLERDYRNGCV